MLSLGMSFLPQRLQGEYPIGGDNQAARESDPLGLRQTDGGGTMEHGGDLPR